MFDKEVFAQLAKEVWHMVSTDAPESRKVLEYIHTLAFQPFREKAARMVLETMAEDLGSEVLLMETATTEDFVSELAESFALITEDTRPEKYQGYPADLFLEVVLFGFFVGYAELCKVAPTDEELSEYRSIVIIPTYQESLRNAIRSMHPSQFAHYTLP